MSKNDIKSYSSNNDAGANNRLTLKQQRFVDSYIRNGGDGARAVIDAGYEVTSTSSIHAISCENLKKPLIRLAFISFYTKLRRFTSHISRLTNLIDLPVKKGLKMRFQNIKSGAFH